MPRDPDETEFTELPEEEKPDGLPESSPPPTKLPPEVLPRPFGRYVLEAVVGEGGMGRVYRATLQGPSGFRKALALKVIKPRRASGREFYEKSFQREARIGGLLHHPNLVDVYDFGVEDGRAFLVMELLIGWSLSQLSKVRGKPPISGTLDLAIQLTRGLRHAHELEVDGEPLLPVHRDLKPGNVWVTEHGRAKILDFGLCGTVEPDPEHPRAGTLRGTPPYMSPEQALGTEELDARSDLFSLGVLIYELACGRHPWRRSSLLAQIRALYEVDSLSASSEFWTVCHQALPALQPILARCLRRKPEDRYPTSGDLLADLLSLRSTLPSGPSFRQWLEDPSLVLPAGPRARTPAPSRSESSSSPPRGHGHNLGTEADSFIGRKAALATLGARIQQNQRLISLVGTGGMGKTRLSQRFGAQQRKNFPGGVWFCDLTEAHTRDGILSAVAGALDVPLTQRDPEAQLADAIMVRGRVLIILDNFEQVVDHAAETVGRWLKRAPEAIFLVTSRVRLRVRGEGIFDLDPLPEPEAMELFYDRASAVQPTFVRDEVNEPIVRDLVQRLDQIALAIELAAVRVRMMTPDQICRRLNQRFKLLREHRRDPSARQGSLRGTIDWSWGLLRSEEQATLAQLSVFGGGSTLEAAEAVLDLSAFEDDPWVLDTLEALVDHSLLRRIEPRAGQVRFRMFDSVREYAAEKLGDKAEATALRHARYFATFGRQEFVDSLGTHGGAEQRQRLRLEMENLLAGTKAALASAEFETALLCALAASEVLELQGPYLGGQRFLESARDERLGPDLRARALTRRGSLLRKANRRLDALPLFEQALAIYRQVGDRKNESVLLGSLGGLHNEGGRIEDSLACYGQSLAISREVGDRCWEGIVVGNIGVLHSHQAALPKPWLTSSRQWPLNGKWETFGLKASFSAISRTCMPRKVAWPKPWLAQSRRSPFIVRSVIAVMKVSSSGTWAPCS